MKELYRKTDGEYKRYVQLLNAWKEHIVPWRMAFQPYLNKPVRYEDDRSMDQRGTWHLHEGEESQVHLGNGSESPLYRVEGSVCTEEDGRGQECVELGLQMYPTITNATRYLRDPYTNAPLWSAFIDFGSLMLGRPPSYAERLCLDVTLYVYSPMYSWTRQEASLNCIYYQEREEIEVSYLEGGDWALDPFSMTIPHAQSFLRLFQAIFQPELARYEHPPMCITLGQ